MKVILRYLNSLFAYFGFVSPRAKHYELALNLLDRTRANAVSIADRRAQGDAEPHPGADPLVPDKTLLYRQLETLREYIATYDLLPYGRNDEEQLGSLARELVTNDRQDQIVPRLDNVATLLDIHRALLTGTARSDIPKSQSPTPVGQTTGSKFRPRAASRVGADKESSLQEKKSEDYAVLWNTTEKLYDSWPIKLLGAFLVSAVLLAGGGTLLIGGKALELRKTLEEAGNKETASFETFAKTTRDTVAAQSQTLLLNLDRQQNEINQKITRTDQQIRDLESRTTQIRDAAIERVTTEIRNNFAPIEQRMQGDLEKHLAKLKGELETHLAELKNGEVHDLQTKIAALGEQVQRIEKDSSDQQAALTDSRSKIRAISEVIADAAALKTQAEFIPEIKKSADEAFAKISEAELRALNTDSRVQILAKDVETRLAPQMTKILEYEGKLGANESSLNALTRAIERIRLDTTSTQQILADAKHANDAISDLHTRIAELTTAIDEIEGRVKRPLPPAVTPISLPKPSLTEKDLSREQWKTIQKSLREFYAGALDGKTGRGTRSAIRRYQQTQNAVANGILTTDQINHLLGNPDTNKPSL